MMMISGLVMIIIGVILKSYIIISNVITAILFALGLIMIAWSGFLITLDAVFECFEQNDDEEIT